MFDCYCDYRLLSAKSERLAACVGALVRINWATDKKQKMSFVTSFTNLFWSLTLPEAAIRALHSTAFQRADGGFQHHCQPRIHHPAGEPGIEQLFDSAAQRALGIHHDRSGDLLAVAAAGAWRVAATATAPMAAALARQPHASLNEPWAHPGVHGDR